MGFLIFYSARETASGLGTLYDRNRVWGCCSSLIVAARRGAAVGVGRWRLALALAGEAPRAG
jgi:hypothetical protein